MKAAFVFLSVSLVFAQSAGSPSSASKPTSPPLTPAQKKDLASYDFQGAVKKLQTPPPGARSLPNVPGKLSLPALQIDTASSRTATASTNPGTVSPVPVDWKPPRAEMNTTALKATSLSAAWESSYNVPAPGADGRVVYSFGGGMPVVVCAPLRVCTIELEPGEHLQSQPQIGDATRWEVTPILSGPEANQTALLTVKPIVPGLDTDLVIPTDRRTYVVRLISDPARYISRVGFRYPAEEQAKWEKFKAQEDAAKREAELAEAQEREKQEKQKAKDKADGVVPMAPDALERIYFDYKLDGETALKPDRVLDDGQHTYIMYPGDGRFRELPTLMIRTNSSKSPELVNFRVVGNKYIVDRLFDKGVLVVGVGKKQRKVTITRLQPYTTTPLVATAGGANGGR
jgi:type IV secretion system protein TrbG